MNFTQHNKSWPIETLIWALAAIPIVALFWVMLEFRTDLVILDEFRHILPRVRSFFEGRFTLYDFWESQNVHKPLIPIAFIMANATFAGWTVVYEQIAGYLGYLLLFVVLVRHQMRSSRGAKINPVNWTIPATAFLLFSLTSWKVFYMGYAALQHGWAIYGAIAGLFVLAQPEFSWKHFALSVVLGLVGTLSFATALLYWPAAFFVLLVKLVEERFRSVKLWIALPLFLLITKIVQTLYLTNMTDRAHPMSFLRHLPKTLNFIFVYLGAPIANYDTDVAFYAGVGGTLVLGLLAYGLIAHRRVELHVLAPYFAMALFSLGSGLLTSSGRLSYGVDTSLDRDWKIFSTPLWIAIPVLLHLFANSERISRFAGNAEPHPGRLPLALRFTGTLGIAVVAGSFLMSTQQEWEWYGLRHSKMLVAERELNEVIALSGPPTTRTPSSGSIEEAAPQLTSPSEETRPKRDRRGRRRAKSQADSDLPQPSPGTVAAQVAYNKVNGIHMKIPENKLRLNLEFLEKNRLANFKR